MEINHKCILKVYKKYFFILTITNIAISNILGLCLTNLTKCETVSVIIIVHEYGQQSFLLQTSRSTAVH